MKMRVASGGIRTHDTLYVHVVVCTCCDIIDMYMLWYIHVRVHVMVCTCCG